MVGKSNPGCQMAALSYKHCCHFDLGHAIEEMGKCTSSGCRQCMYIQTTYRAYMVGMNTCIRS